ncbi:toprim domain-containing protein [Mucilaginibacter sabulilitoris]|uniref:Toprim domain-containing protein n=1 Tax=Mucilaginibacter sabulilitoris TaxID=1173583 RepID=A0ABZ0TRL7_9SPHI|nr:toprim domain-containing protein [Mucilaginibacter sabulilitoris]WPU95759.1 toprim domain-containing protein [Mucilaginibacter sabulilitoris]
MTNFIDVQVLRDSISLVELLARLGYEPFKKSGKELMYFSMLRSAENTPSLCVNEELGVWYDHGTGKGGTMIEFAKAYWQGLSFVEILDRIRQAADLSIDNASRKTSPERNRDQRPRAPVKIPHYLVEQVKDLGNNPAITAYLQYRNIWHVAGNQLKEVYYYVEDEKKNRKQFFAAGWQNENGGWEVRNKYFKGCLGRKGMSFIGTKDQRDLVLFEGYVNYLSWLTEHQKKAPKNILVLNSLSFLTAAIERSRHFEHVEVYFDHDPAGIQATEKLLKTLPHATDQSGIYQQYNDYNEKLMTEGVDTSRLWSNGANALQSSPDSDRCI